MKKFLFLFCCTFLNIIFSGNGCNKGDKNERIRSISGIGLLERKIPANIQSNNKIQNIKKNFIEEGFKPIPEKNLQIINQFIITTASKNYFLEKYIEKYKKKQKVFYTGNETIKFLYFCDEEGEATYLQNEQDQIKQNSELNKFK